MRPALRSLAALALVALAARGASGQDASPALSWRLGLVPNGAPDGTGPDSADADTVAASLLRRAPAFSTGRTAAVLGAGVALAVGETFRRTQDDRRLTGPFTVEADWGYARWADKLGHVYTSGFFTRQFRAAYRWAGMSERDARLAGGASGFGALLYYEMLDGFGRNESFSPPDMAANAVGAGLETLRPVVPALQALTLKMSYWPSGDGCDAGCDYEGQTAWLAVNPRRLAPGSGLPPWLSVAVGYGARDGDIHEGFAQSAVYVGLDLEPAGLPFRGPLWEAMLPVLRYVHFPAPALRLAPGVRPVLFAY